MIIYAERMRNILSKNQKPCLKNFLGENNDHKTFSQRMASPFADLRNRNHERDYSWTYNHGDEMTDKLKAALGEQKEE